MNPSLSDLPRRCNAGGRRLLPLPLLLLLGCQSSTVTVGEFTIQNTGNKGLLTIEHRELGTVLEDLELSFARGTTLQQSEQGAFALEGVQLRAIELEDFSDEDEQLTTIDSIPQFLQGERSAVLQLWAGREFVGDLFIEAVGEGLRLDWTPVYDPGEVNVLQLQAACDLDEEGALADHFLGLGSYSQTLDHAGERFTLWASEPGPEQSEQEAAGALWPDEGVRHSSSSPAPFIMRPHRSQGILLDAGGMVQADFCHRDSSSFSLRIWDEPRARVTLFADHSPLELLEQASEWTGRMELPQPWMLGPWQTLRGGSDAVLEQLDVLSAAGVPGGVVLTPDWSGQQSSPAGLLDQRGWEFDSGLYPDPGGLGDALESRGLRWLTQVSPLVEEDGDDWELAAANSGLVTDAQGVPLRLDDRERRRVGMVDLSTEPQRAWMLSRLQDQLELGVDGWLATDGEWLPRENVLLADGQTGAEAHHDYIRWWLELQEEAQRGRDAIVMADAGWMGTGGLAAVLSEGQIDASFSARGGLGSSIHRALGASLSGQPVFSPSLGGGYLDEDQPITQELWRRWAGLAAWSPLLRDHVGPREGHWGVFSDTSSLLLWAELSQEQSKLLPYRHALLKRASEQGTPMILPLALALGSEDWERDDAWMLGPSFMVAPVLEEGVSGRHVELPEEQQWYDWDSLSPACSGWKEAAPGEVPVFVPAGSIIPSYSEAPVALSEARGLRPTPQDLDAARVVTLFGSKRSITTDSQGQEVTTRTLSRFTEADGTVYQASGMAKSRGNLQVVMKEGAVEVAGMRIEVSGRVERHYTFVVLPEAPPCGSAPAEEGEDTAGGADSGDSGSPRDSGDSGDL